jgi:protein required for attachment to host cells
VSDDPLTEIKARPVQRVEGAGTKIREFPMPKHRKLCFVVADGGHARFLRPAPDFALHTFEALDSSTVHKKDHDLVSDREGRSFESAGTGRSAYSPRHDPHEMAKEHFAHTVAKRLNEKSAAGTFNELVIVAPTHVLTELTEALDTTTSAKLIGSLAKDLVKTSDHDLSPHLKEWVRPVHRA